MAILLHCDGCGKKIRAGDAWAGREATCPGCGNSIAVPSVPADDPLVKWAEAQHVHVSPQEIDELAARGNLNTAGTAAQRNTSPTGPPPLAIVITEVRLPFAAVVNLVWQFFWATVVVAFLVAVCLLVLYFLLLILFVVISGLVRLMERIS